MMSHFCTSCAELEIGQCQDQKAENYMGEVIVIL